MFVELPLLPAEVARVEAAIRARNHNIYNETAALLSSLEEDEPATPFEETALESRKQHVLQRLAAMDKAGMVDWN